MASQKSEIDSVEEGREVHLQPLHSELAIVAVVLPLNPDTAVEYSSLNNMEKGLNPERIRKTQRSATADCQCWVL